MKKYLAALFIVAFAVLAFGQVTGKYFGFTPDRYWDNNGVLKTDNVIWTYGTSNALKFSYSDSVYTSLVESSAGDLTASVTGVTSVTRRALVGAMTTPASVTSGNLVGARGSVTMPNSSSVTGGYLYGLQGKAITGTGTFAGTVLAGVYGQLDVTGGTVSAGHVSPIQSNIYGANSGAYPYLVGLYVEHAGGGVIDSLLELFGKSDYVFRIASNTHTNVSTTGTCTTPGQAHGWLKIIVDGAVRYIPLSEAVS
jgi:hypothetical protein